MELVQQALSVHLVYKQHACDFHSILQTRRLSHSTVAHLFEPDDTCLAQAYCANLRNCAQDSKIAM
jgi:hypothetical protein